MRSLLNHNRVIGLILLVFIAWWAYLTGNLPPTTMPTEPGPKFFPYVILGIMAIFSAALLFIKPEKANDDAVPADDVENEASEEEQEFAMKDVLILFAIFFGGIMLVRYMGFNIGLIVSMTIMLVFIGWKILRALLFSAAVTITLFFLFSWFLKIPLPKGTLF